MKNISIIIYLSIFLASLMVTDCARKTSSKPAQEIVINDNFEYYLTNYKFENLNNSLKSDLNDINSKNLLNYYYLKMKMAYTAYTVGNLLQNYEYNKNFKNGQTKSSELKNLGSVLKVLLLSNYLENSEIDSYKNVDKSQNIEKSNPLYYRYQVMKAVASGNLKDKILIDYPQTACRYGYDIIPNPGTLSTKDRSLIALDQMIVAEKRGSLGILDSLFYLGAKTPLFYYKFRYPNNQAINIYDVESLGLAFSYYSDKLIALCKQTSDVSEMYKNYLLANCYYYHGDIKNTKQKLRPIIDNEQSGFKELSEISKAIYQGCQKNFPSDFNDHINDFHSNLAKVKYCETLFQFSGFSQVNQIDSVFSEVLNSGFEEEDSREGKYYSLPESEDVCTNTEILFLIGRYFLFTNQLSNSEKCFLSIYQLNKSFSLKDNINCGNLFEYDPAENLICCSYAMVHNKVMLPIISQEISASSMTERIFLIPSKLLSNVITPPDIYSDNKIE